MRRYYHETSKNTQLYTLFLEAVFQTLLLISSPHFLSLVINLCFKKHTRGITYSGSYLVLSCASDQSNKVCCSHCHILYILVQLNYLAFA